MDEKAQKRIAQVMWFVDQSCQSEHPTQRHLDSAEEVLKTLEQLGYRKLPKDRPPLLSGKEAKEAWARPIKDIKDGHELFLIMGNNCSELSVTQAQWDIWNKAIYEV